LIADRRVGYSRRMNWILPGLVLAVGGALFGCSDHVSGSSGGHGSSNAPHLAEATPMAGGIHVTWHLPATACDSIEGERKTDADPYAVVFTVPGQVDNKHDAEATEDATYTYRLRCKRGDDYSDYSNELSANPVN
jgi:hypothetical protein